MSLVSHRVLRVLLAQRSLQQVPALLYGALIARQAITATLLLPFAQRVALVNMRLLKAVLFANSVWRAIIRPKQEQVRVPRVDLATRRLWARARARLAPSALLQHTPARLARPVHLH